ncbi:hypothetical protein J2125_000532 [Erwinia toletana]|uniref:Uncharacterized protein n=2 Tax=Winslowiella toletana TaxID=92490 RepID=A0ABS4P3X8_9GAMM|nr:hypothetical protein [Winslowiella toletana]
MPLVNVKGGIHLFSAFAGKNSELLFFRLIWLKSNLLTGSHFKAISVQMLDVCQIFVICRF